MEGLTDAHNDQYLIVPNKPLEWTGHHQLSATQPQVLCLPLRGSVRRMTGKARTTSICWKAVDCPLGKAEGHLAGFQAKVEHESGQDEGYGKAL